MTALFVVVGLASVGLAVAVLGARSLVHGRRDRRLGTLVEVDDGRGTTLVADRYRLAGRPDAVRRRPDGASVPVELKHRSAPERGPFRSHVVQLEAYCLLLEETTGRSPPFGVLRYSDREYRVDWNGAVRRRLLDLRAEVSAPYDGRADPSPAKCLGCVWSPRCDASLAGVGRAR